MTYLGDISLIDERISSVEDVLLSLNEHKKDTEWSIKTTDFAINHIKKFEQKYNKNCAKGFLPKKYFFDILLPSHGHLKDWETGILLFPYNVSVEKALEYHKISNPLYTKDCLEMIDYFKDQIKNKGFTSRVIVEIIDNELRHIDGLHRMIALGLLLKEGYEYKPIPVYLLKR